MSYCTIEDIQSIIPSQHLINLTNDTAPAKEINILRVEGAIEYADEFINSYLRNKYKLPLTYIPDIIKQVSTDISCYRLYSRRPQDIPEHIKENYKEAKNILSQLQGEKMLLDLPSEHPQEDVVNSAPMIKTNKNKNSIIFSQEMLKGFKL